MIVGVVLRLITRYESVARQHHSIIIIFNKREVSSPGHSVIRIEFDKAEGIEWMDSRDKRKLSNSPRGESAKMSPALVSRADGDEPKCDSPLCLVK